MGLSLSRDGPVLTCGCVNFPKLWRHIPVQTKSHCFRNTFQANVDPQIRTNSNFIFLNNNVRQSFGIYLSIFPCRSLVKLAMPQHKGH